MKLKKPMFPIYYYRNYLTFFQRVKDHRVTGTFNPGVAKEMSVTAKHH